MEQHEDHSLNAYLHRLQTEELYGAIFYLAHQKNILFYEPMLLQCVEILDERYRETPEGMPQKVKDQIDLCLEEYLRRKKAQLQEEKKTAASN